MSNLFSIYMETLPKYNSAQFLMDIFYGITIIFQIIRRRFWVNADDSIKHWIWQVTVCVCVCVRSSLPIVYTKFYSNKYTEWKDMEVLL